MVRLPVMSEFLWRVGLLRPGERVLLLFTDAARAVAGRRLGTFVWLARFGGRAAGAAGGPGAVRAVLRAYRQVPAYRRFVDEVGGLPARPRGCSAGQWLALLPVTGKHGYIDRYPIEQRCRGGVLPVAGVEVDESAGSSGRPYQWVRSDAELRRVHRTLRLLARYLLGDGRPVVTLNGFSMGAWATGINVSAALRGLGAVKSCGPDPEKMLAAMRLYGTSVRYAVCGYPPFLQQLVRAAEQAGLDLAGYELVGLVGGEGMGEGLRRELERVFARVWSAYGASDLDIGVAGETPVSVWLRQAADADPQLAQALFGRTDRLPMVFQYDPSSYHIEQVEGQQGPELVVTVLRRTLAPRLRYAVGDAGGVLELHAALATAARFGAHWPTGAEAVPQAAAMLELPLVYLHGRADSTISFMGANLYPEDVAAGLEDASALPLLADVALDAFCLELAGDVDPSPGCTSR
jgi:phenylacetate-CoA ligase